MTDLECLLVLRALLLDDELVLLEDRRHLAVPRERGAVEAHVGRRQRRVVDEEGQTVLRHHQFLLQFADRRVFRLRYNKKQG